LPLKIKSDHRKWLSLPPMEKAAIIEHNVEIAPDSQYKRNELERARKLRDEIEKGKA